VAVLVLVVAPKEKEGLGAVLTLFVGADKLLLLLLSCLLIPNEKPEVLSLLLLPPLFSLLVLVPNERAGRLSLLPISLPIPPMVPLSPFLAVEDANPPNAKLGAVLEVVLVALDATTLVIVVLGTTGATAGDFVVVPNEKPPSSFRFFLEV